MKPYPWPAVTFDPAAIAAAAAFNLLLVFAFLNPTRVAVATVVREKELRLREGMRILGLKVAKNPDTENAAHPALTDVLYFRKVQ